MSPDDELLAFCEDCELPYRVGHAGIPLTSHSYTCDDCGGYVDVDETGDLRAASIARYGQRTFETLLALEADR